MLRRSFWISFLLNVYLVPFFYLQLKYDKYRFTSFNHRIHTLTKIMPFVNIVHFRKHAKAFTNTHATVLVVSRFDKGQLVHWIVVVVKCRRWCACVRCVLVFVVIHWKQLLMLLTFRLTVRNGLHELVFRTNATVRSHGINTAFWARL